MTAAEARAERTQRLFLCDWTQSPDAKVTENERARWRTYRDLLRDVPLQPGFPDEIVWPQEPERDPPYTPPES